MKFSTSILLMLLFFSWSQTFGQTSKPGNLVIVGGGLEDNNAAVYQEFINLAGGAAQAKVAIIPSAGGTPVQSFQSYKYLLTGYGLQPDNIILIPVAVVDDDSTIDADESQWKNNGSDPRLADLIRTCSAVWFTGGDQLRTTRALYMPDGSQTLVLKAVWDVYRGGGVIGGTSAGAAIMSNVMIGGGTSLAALQHGVIRDYHGDDFPESQGVLISQGFGFFPYGIVDQHFNARARIGRLAVALMDAGKNATAGFGIDENTALIFYGHHNSMMVAGTGGVTILKTDGAAFSFVRNKPVIENITVSYLETGDTYDFITGTVKPSPGKVQVRGAEHYKTYYWGRFGLLSSGEPSIRECMTRHLIDNKANDSVQNITPISIQEGYQLTLRKNPESQGFFEDRPGFPEQYTVTGIMMDLVPVQISVKPIK